MKGSIKTEIKIDCGICLRGTSLFSGTKKEAAGEARRMGWIKTAKHGWVCSSSCLQTHTNE